MAEIEKEKGDGDYETIYEQTDGSTTPPSTVKSSDHVTRIYACATMWHENKEEMMEFLKSILRLDEDQCARRVAQKYLKVVDPDYYEFESELTLHQVSTNLLLFVLTKTCVFFQLTFFSMTLSNCATTMKTSRK